MSYLSNCFLTQGDKGFSPYIFLQKFIEVYNLGFTFSVMIGLIFVYGTQYELKYFCI